MKEKERRLKAQEEKKVFPRSHLSFLHHGSLGGFYVVVGFLPILYMYVSVSFLLVLFVWFVSL